jgi:hypothetical protein
LELQEISRFVTLSHCPVSLRQGMISLGAKSTSISDNFFVLIVNANSHTARE